VNQQITKGIVLSRTDFGEADRIITVLTPGHGKLRLMAKGVRKINSKLAGGIELFSISDLTFISGRGEVKTLVSSRLEKHFGNIVSRIDRVQLGYELIKMLNWATEDRTDESYFILLYKTFEALDDHETSSTLIDLWFRAQLLNLGGNSPNLSTDTEGDRLVEGVKYNFDLETVAFTPHASGKYGANDIKVLRLIFSDNPPIALKKVRGINEGVQIVRPIISKMVRNYIY
jgi:DNA repair protein RecO (recombination protein O)